ncbi:uncharacterized protein E0L32_004658 [Thyridium curvatum]|uniref:C2H2-type domain-containing protein n=1 Tax=Thyridium curvatum TaxID=1093900 RepID=A0A507BEY9_9PEZI|nr:uncharacterized protein E0L32_004658 [Thyridium curvatum]TPX15100.1 hypothetical protein E0L32_004658 [Thyridium curvatum]
MRNDHEDFNALYPDPMHGNAFPNGPMDSMGLSPDAAYGYPRTTQECFPTTMNFDPNGLYAEVPYMFNGGHMSPHAQPEEADPRGAASLSTASLPSAASSAVGSPRSIHGQPTGVPEWPGPQGLGVVSPGIVGHGDYFPGADYSFAGPSMDDFTAFDFTAKAGFVDPSILHPDVRPMGMSAFEPTYPQPPNSGYPASPAMTGTASPQLRNGSSSPPFSHNNFHQYSPFPVPMDQGRRPSMGSFHSSYSMEQNISGDESKEKQRCPHPECGKVFKDLKAHMLTHQTERPEKCPIQTCEYHTKGFARKYDKNRHTLTHYKGTMVCGFCPGSGSAAEKSFNRADVFKRHLTAVHGVEQTPPNSRRKTQTASANGKKLTGYAPDATGKCSTCSATFSNAQDFYEHLDDCVLRIVQQEDPAEAVNAKRLAEVENDREVVATLEKNQLPTTTQVTSTSEDEEDEEMDEDEDDDKSGVKSSTSPGKKSKGNPANGVQKSRGMTHSRGGVPLVGKTRGRKNRRDYPSSWGFDKGQMTMKKRVMAVFDGQRRLAKDDLMLSTDHEVRVKLSDGKAYVTDLDVQTMKRAEGFLGATEEEKGIWISDDPTEEQLLQMAAAMQQ